MTRMSRNKSIVTKATLELEGHLWPFFLFQCDTTGFVIVNKQEKAFMHLMVRLILCNYIR